MHEYSVAASILSFCNTELKKQNAGKIKTVYLAIGVMGGVEKYLLTEAFNTLKQTAGHKDAALEINLKNLSVQCHSCGTETSCPSPVFNCPSCGSSEVVLDGGGELMIEKIEFFRPHDE